MTADPGPVRRDPARGLSGIGAALLGTHAVVVALAIPAVTKTSHDVPAVAVAGLVAIAVLDVVVAGLVRRAPAVAVVAGTVLIAGSVVAGVLSGILLFLGIVFAALWGAWLAMRRAYLRGPTATLADRTSPGSPAGEEQG